MRIETIHESMILLYKKPKQSLSCNENNKILSLS